MHWGCGMRSYIVVVFKDDEPDRHFPISEERYLIGRDETADIQLPHPTISREHAYLSLHEGMLRIEDHKSTNGILVNGKCVAEARLEEGDFVLLGAYRLVVRAVDEPFRDVSDDRETFFVRREELQQSYDAFFTQAESKLIHTFYSMARAVANGMQTPDLARLAIECALEHIPARRGGVLQGDRIGNLDTVAVVCKSEEHRNIPFSRKLVSYAYSTHTAFLSQNAKSDERFAGEESPTLMGQTAVLLVPIVREQHVVGVIYLDGEGAGPVFTQKHLEFLVVIADLVGAHMEYKLAAARDKQRERLIAIGEAVGSVTHDMRNIFQAIKGGVQLLSDENGQNGDARVGIDVLNQGVERFENLLSDLLLYGGQREPEKSCIQMKEVLGDVAVLAKSLAPGCKIDLRIEEDAGALIEGDANMLHRAFLNIVKNATEAVRDGGGAVTVSLIRESNHAVVRISDTGVGMSSEELRRIGEPFFTTKKRTGGTGIGLACAHQVVRQHGGGIRVDSARGRGTVFTITLPTASSNKPVIA